MSDVKIYEDRSLIETAALPDPSNLICTAVSVEWANKIADVLAKEYAVGTVLVMDGKKLPNDI